MIPTLIFFIPAAICLLVAAVGLACLGLASLALWRGGRSPRQRPVSHAAPPILGDMRGSETARGASAATAGAVAPIEDRMVNRRRVCELLVLLSLVVFLLGAFGLWAGGLRVGWRRTTSAEWTDGRAPDLATLAHKRCVKFIAQGKSTGISVALVSLTNATVMAVGRQALTGPAVSADTLFELGSITKTFTAIALAREIDAGQLRLDQPIRELLPPGFELPEPARDITLRHLTTHTSGFPRLASNMPKLGGWKMLAFGSDPYAGYGEADLLEGVRHVRLESAPGTKSVYSNFGMTLLGYLLARHSGTNYEAFIKQAVCHPLDMNDTTIRLRQGQVSRVAQGYRALVKLGPLVIGLRSAPWFEDNDLGGAGALRSSGNDMLKYLQSNMHPAGPLENALLASHRGLFKESEHVTFGMNWIRSPNKTLNQTVIWHNGGTGGFRSFLGFTEDGRFGVVVLSNSGEEVDDLGMALLRDLGKRESANR